MKGATEYSVEAGANILKRIFRSQQTHAASLLLLKYYSELVVIPEMLSQTAKIETTFSTQNIPAMLDIGYSLVGCYFGENCEFSSEPC